MYKIITTKGAVLGYTDEIVYIKWHPNGSITLANGKEDAEGIAFDSTPYNIPGSTAFGETETVLAEKTTMSEINGIIDNAAPPTEVYTALIEMGVKVYE